MKAWSFWEKSRLESDFRDSVTNQYAMLCMKAKKDTKGHLEEQPVFMGGQNGVREWASDCLKSHTSA